MLKKINVMCEIGVLIGLTMGFVCLLSGINKYHAVGLFIVFMLLTLIIAIMGVAFEQMEEDKKYGL